jgi:hypothetical protein
VKVWNDPYGAGEGDNLGKAVNEAMAAVEEGWVESGLKAGKSAPPLGPA